VFVNWPMRTIILLSLIPWLDTISLRATDLFPNVDLHAESTRLPERDLQEILHLICPGYESDFGCRICPEGSNAHQPGGLGIQLILRGHFLGTGSDDLLVETTDSEAHTGLFSGKMWFTHVAGGWFVSRPYSPVSPGTCRAIRNNSGLDGLLCWLEDAHSDDTGGVLSFH
jgi:hypothetical protein